MKTLGIILGYLVTWILQAFRSKALRYVLTVAGGILLMPLITEYWLARIHIPDIPLSANVFMFVSTAFLFVFCVAMYLGMLMLQQIRQGHRPIQWPGFSAVPQDIKATGGDFIPTDDAQLRDREDMAILKGKGILHDTDVEGLASEIRHAALMKARGRTE